jgi:pimeloyl-ACP methyl ester carboxylesterase
MRIISLVLVGLAVASCTTIRETASEGVQAELGMLRPAVPCTDTSHTHDEDATGIMGDPGPLPNEKGAIIKCSRRPDVSSSELQKSTYEYPGQIKTDATVYQIAYRTERGDEANTPGYGSAVVIVPNVLRADKLPVVVSSHGTNGEGQFCWSHGSATADGYIHAPLVNAGYIVIAPDLAGYMNYGAPNNPPSAYADAADVGKSTLDAARALRKMFPTRFNDKVVVVGHSQGGGTALAALAMNESYGSGGTLAGIVSYAPLWLSNATWAAVDLFAQHYPIQRADLPNAVAMWYMYTQGELHDGRGHGVDAFREDKRAMVKDFVEHTCYATLGFGPAWGTSLKDVYDPQLMASLATPAETGGPCADALCEKWKKRMNASRPHLTGSATNVPILFAYGGRDSIIVPERMACALERLDTDHANYKLCYDEGAGHAEIVGRQADYVNAWIGARSLGEPEPQPTCADHFDRPACASVPPNEWN